MERRKFLRLLSLGSVPFITSSMFGGCAYSRIDPWHVLIRSDRITSLEQEQAIISKGKLSWTADGKIRVLFVQGSPYERGYQHGVLLRKEVQDNLGYIHRLALKKFHFEELFNEVYERMRSYIPEEYVEEMHGLAHGARIPLTLVHHLHILPCLGEWGGKKKVKAVIKQMMVGDLGTSCSNFSVASNTTLDDKHYVVRILDWGLHKISKLHEYPLITVTIPESGIPSANIGWVGFLGAVSGMNAQGITLGEMGYGDPDNETLRGIPMPFLLRNILSYTGNLAEVRKTLKDAIGSNSFAFLMSDGKTGKAELYIKDRDRFLVFPEGTNAHDKEELLPAIPQVSYGGHFNEKMTEMLQMNHGKYTLEMIQKDLIPGMVMKSNFQNVIYSPQDLQFWVNNAKDRKTPAVTQPYTFFDLRDALRNPR